MTEAVHMVSVPASAGIWRAADQMASAVRLAGRPADVVDRAATERNHFHLGNSTRGLVLPMARHVGSVVTVHDAIPRNPWVRRTLSPLQARFLRRFHVVTHSRHAADLLTAAGWRGEATIVPSLLPIGEIDPTAVETWRSSWAADEYRLTLVSAGEVRASKGVIEIVDAARHFPDVLVVLLGRITDPAMRNVVDEAPRNVVHAEAPDDDAFAAAIAAGDALLSVRRESVGETSGPVVQAHRLHRPVVGLSTGSLPETCGPGDLLLPPTSSVAELISAAVNAELQPLPAGSAQVPDPVAVGRILDDLYRRIGW